MTTTPLIRPPLDKNVEHLFTPLVWVKAHGDTWEIEIDWSESYQHSHDTVKQEDVEPLGRSTVDTETASHVLGALLQAGVLPKGDSVASQPWQDIDFDPLEYFA